MSWENYDGQQCLLTIYNGQAGEDVELTPSENPFITREDDDSDPFIPVRTETANISFIAGVNGDYPRAEANTRWYVKLKVANTVKWVGFLKGESLSQDYDSELHEITIGAVNILGALDSFNYHNLDGDNFTIKTLGQVIYDCMKNVMPGAEEGYYTAYIANTGSTSSSTSVESLLSSICVNTYNLYEEIDDENGETSWQGKNCGDIVRSICTFFGWSLRANAYNLYFSRIGCPVYKYLSFSLFSYANIVNANFVIASAEPQLTPNEENHMITIEPGVKDVVISAKTQTIDNILPDIKMTNMRKSWDSQFTITFRKEETQQDTPTPWRVIYAEPKNDLIEFCQYRADNYQRLYNLQPWNGSTIFSNYYGAMLIRHDWWAGPEGFEGSAKTDSEHINYRFNDDIFLRLSTLETQHWPGHKLFSLRGDKLIQCCDGAFVINFQSHLIQRLEYDYDHLYWEVNYHSGIYSGNTMPTDSYIYMEYELKIGNLYWNGTAFTTSPSRFRVKIKPQEAFSLASIDSNKTTAMSFTSTGHVIPIDEQICGVAELSLYNVYWYERSPRSEANKRTPRSVIINNFSFEYKSVEEIGSFESSKKDHTYKKTNQGWMGEHSTELEFVSYRNEGANYNSLMHYDAKKTPLREIYSNEEMVLNETALLNAINDHFKESREVLTIKTKVGAYTSPYGIHIIRNKHFNAISAASRNWRTNEAELILKDYE